MLSKDTNLVQQYARCSQSYQYFRSKYVYIQHKQKGKIKYQPFDYQQKLSSALDSGKNSVVIKARQMGISTQVSIYCVWLILFNAHKQIAVIASKDKVAMNFISTVKFAMKNLPDFLKIRTLYDNLHQIRLINQSSIQALACTQDAGRSLACSFLVFDQIAFVAKSIAYKVWSAAQQTLATGGSFCVLSTPNGQGGLFYDLCRKAQTKQIKAQFFSLPWYLHPQKTQRWRDQQDGIQGKVLAAQQLDCSFISSGTKIIRGQDIQKFKNNNIRQQYHSIKVMRDFIPDPYQYQQLLRLDPQLLGRIFVLPKQNHQYIIGADVGRGDGSDCSTIQILDATTLQQCYQYKGFIGTTQFAKLICAVGTIYNCALAVVQNNNYGWAVLQQMVQMQYPNIFYSPKKQILVADKQNPLNVQLLKCHQKVIGFSTTSASRPLILQGFRQKLQNQVIAPYSSRLYAQVDTWIWKNGRMDHMDGYNDDLILAYSIALWVRQMYIHKLKMGNKNIAKSHLTMMSDVMSMVNKQRQSDPYLKKQPNRFKRR